jgi:hypothetical protein
MKSSGQIRRRIEKLRFSYFKKYVKENTDKLPHNCSHNFLLRSDSRSLKSRFINTPIIPAKQVTLLIYQEENEIRVCSYGKGSKEWNGVICDSVDKSKSCPYFSNIRSKSDIELDFSEKMNDDNYVRNNYPDIASLQWVLENRFYGISFGWFLRFSYSILYFFRNIHFKKIKKDALKNSDLKDIWDENT